VRACGDTSTPYLLSGVAKQAALVGPYKGTLHGQLLLDELNDLDLVFDVLDQLLLDVHTHGVAVVLKHLFRLVDFLNAPQVVAVPLVEVALLRDRQIRLHALKALRVVVVHGELDRRLPVLAQHVRALHHWLQ